LIFAVQVLGRFASLSFQDPDLVILIDLGDIGLRGLGCGGADGRRRILLGGRGR
jgi:hypothetical protein